MSGGAISARLATSRGDREISPFTIFEGGAITWELNGVLRIVGEGPTLDRPQCANHLRLEKERVDGGR